MRQRQAQLLSCARGRRQARTRVEETARGRPIVGFVGALYEWVDWTLIAEVVRAVPDCDFVFVGPQHGRGSTGVLRGLDNAMLLGARPYDRVPGYLQAFDVCWVPFDQSRVSRAANPHVSTVR